eukprot:s3581_g6.t1
MDAWRKNLKSPWLHCTLKKKAARLGCASCAAAGLSGPWAEFEQRPLGLKLHHLKRHENSKAHLSSMSSEEAQAAPDMEIFREALKKMRSGASSRDGGVYSDKKHQIRWCISEACLQVARTTLREALAIAITRDERKGRLLLRWRACGPNFTASSGVLGFLPVEGFSDDLAAKTQAAIKAFCTPAVGLPRGFVAAPADTKFDQAAEASIRQKTSILITDAASPELLASGLLSGRRPYAESGARATYLSAVKVVGRDAPHASCRVIKRPFSASPELMKLMQEYINGPGSFCQKVWHSPLYTAWWQELVTVGPSSLSCAKHRFASYALPLGRLSDNLKHMVTLCHKIALIRGTSGQWASLLLTHMTGEKLALLGMAADAAQTCSDLTRSMDDEGADISELHSRVQQFAYSIEALFLSEREWVETSLKILEAEFPAWHLLNCFDVFALANGTSASCKRAQDKDKALAKLANAFAVNEADLRAEFVSVLPTAQALQRQGGLDNRSAWAEALTRLQKTSALRKKYPMEALLKVWT